MSGNISDSAKGYRIEKLVASACEILRDKREILHYIHAQPGRQLDAEGIDILVQLNSGLFFGIQCKANLYELGKHLKKHPNITYVLVVGPFSRKSVKRWKANCEISLKLCVQILNTRSEIRTNIKNYNKILEQAVIQLRHLVAIAMLR